MDPSSTASSIPYLTVIGTSAAIVVLLVLSGLFSGSETALTTASRGKLHGMADKGDKAAATAMKLTDDKERLIGAILLGNNFVNIMAASLATSLFTCSSARAAWRSPRW
jgi:Mg2+/Co2+ transporter CorB